MREQYKVVVDPEYGYRRLEPLPTAEELDRFYREQYFDLAVAGGRAPDLKRLMSGGDEAQAELAWLSQTRWRDILDILNQHLGHKQERTLLDVGCGLGYFARYMVQAGWHVVGIEPSHVAQRVARSFGITIYSSIEECCEQTECRFDAVSLLHVLEHVIDPVSLLSSLRAIMDKEGLLVILVPNDFSSLQEHACQKLDLEPWWIAIPDHINYFNFESLRQFVERLGFQVVDMLGDFPMETFLLFGENYVNNPEIGSLCHKKRISFELALPPKIRRDLYRSFARAGIGRNCLLFAKPVL